MGRTHLGQGTGDTSGVTSTRSKEAEALGPRPATVVTGLTAFWLAVGLLAGTGAWLADRGGPEPRSLVEAFRGPVVAGLVWIPLTLGIIGFVRRLPPLRITGGWRLHPGPFALHLVVSLAVSFVLNAVFLALTRPALLADPGVLTRITAQFGLSYLHFNMGGYWAIVLATLAAPVLLAGRRSGAGRATPDPVLTVRSGNQTIPVPVTRIRWIEASGDYVTLHLADAEYLLSERLKTLESRLDPERFVRVHRSAIVNVAAVRKLRHLGHGDYEATLDEGSVVRISRTRRARFRKVLEAREVPAAEE